MPRLTVRDFELDDLEPAGVLLAARQKRDRVRLPMLSVGLESPTACTQLLEPLLRSPRSAGVVALNGSTLVGFLFGEKMTLAPNELAAMFFAPHSISMPIHGHAAAETSDATAVYRALYGELAGRWARNGFFVHMTHITPGDPELQEAWVALGFGRGNTCAVRDTSPVSGFAPAKVDIHQASPEDLGVVMALNDALYAF
ncbi:MAG: hypothetical protein ABI305_02355, partial [Tepidiformaceae bacterium]